MVFKTNLFDKLDKEFLRNEERTLSILNEVLIEQNGGCNNDNRNRRV